MTKEPLILAIGGGKGGVGKSMVSSNLAVQYAQAGLKVIILDLDIGAANLHTIFGMRQPPKGLGHYFTTPRSLLTDYCIETLVPNLLLIPGSGFVPELANLKHVQKLKIMSHIKALEADLVILDLGAGTSSNVIDFFSMTHAGIIVTTPEPTAIVNAYEFLKNVIYRILFRVFKNQEELLNLLKASTMPNQENATIADLVKTIAKKNAWAARNIEEICADLDFHVIFNQSRSLNDLHLGTKLHGICKRYLNIDLSFAGMIFFNEEVSTSVHKMCPMSIAYPNAVTSQTLKRIALNTLNQITERMTSNKTRQPFEEQVRCSLKYAKQDYEQNVLTQKQLQRDREARLSVTLT